MRLTKDYDRLASKLDDIKNSCSKKGWDGYSATPINVEWLKKLVKTADMSRIIQKFEMIGIPQKNIWVVPIPSKGAKMVAQGVLEAY